MPISCPGGQVYFVKSGDTLFQLAQRFNTTVNRIILANADVDTSYLRVGQKLCIPMSIPIPVTCPGGTEYRVKQGDTLYALARTFNVSVTDIINANPGINPNLLYIGQLICVPTTEPQPVPRPRCIVLNPTDITPNSKGMAFIESEINALFALVTNVPKPTTLPEGEVYKLWVQQPNISQMAVTTMQELIPGYWMARIATGFPLTGANIIISSEKAANNTAPAGLGVAVGNL